MILMLLKKSNLEEISNDDIDRIVYSEIPVCDEWRIPVVETLIETMTRESDIPDFDNDEIKDILFNVCTT